MRGFDFSVRDRERLGDLGRRRECTGFYSLHEYASR